MGFLVGTNFSISEFLAHRMQCPEAVTEAIEPLMGVASDSDHSSSIWNFFNFFPM